MKFEDVFGPEDEPEEDEERPEDIAVRDRARAAANMLVDGAPYYFIAETLGYKSPAQARVAAERVLGAMHNSADREAARNVTRARLNKMLKIASEYLSQETIVVKRKGKDVELVNTEQYKWFMGFLAVTDRLAKLDGLDAPVKVEVRNPDAEEFEAVIHQMERLVGRPMSIEGDPFASQPLMEIEAADGRES